MRGILIKGLALIVGLFVTYMLYRIFMITPFEKSMGVVQKLMYFHVPSAITGYIAFSTVCVASILYLWKKDERFDRLALSAAEIGVLFFSLVLITGSLWARPIWNTWWTWEPRLTTALILWFIFVGYLLLRNMSPNNERMRKVFAIYAIIGAIDIPIVHMSVKWWRTIHPRVIENRGLPPEMESTLYLNLLAFLFIFILLLILRYRLELSKLKVERLKEETL